MNVSERPSSEQFCYLFVCVHNAGRSQIAQAFVNYYATHHDLPVIANSAGTSAGGVLNPLAVLVMAELGISMESQHPKMLTKEMVDKADKVITMGCGVETACPAGLFICEDWGLDDPAKLAIDDVRKVRDEINQRVKGLLGLNS